MGGSSEGMEEEERRVEAARLLAESSDWQWDEALVSEAKFDYENYDGGIMDEDEGIDMDGDAVATPGGGGRSRLRNGAGRSPSHALLQQALATAGSTANGDLVAPAVDELLTGLMPLPELLEAAAPERDSGYGLAAFIAHSAFRDAKMGTLFKPEGVAVPTAIRSNKTCGVR